MIKFKNVAGQSFLAVGTIQRKSALNGEKSLTGTIYDGDDVLNKIDKGWSLEFGDEPYVITYFERNDNDNTVSFDAIHRFFWNTAKSVLYTSASGSHAIKWYLDQIFSNTGYTYALNYAPTAIRKDNWGMKTKLSLFNDIISSIGGEFEINGTLVSIFEKVGTDLSTIVRYGFNLSDMSVENNAAGFVTYGEGFGVYADQQNQRGDRLHVTYTSPLASVYGKLQAEPVDDQRFTIQSNLLNAVKDEVDGSFSVSIKLSLYDLTAAGYPYKMANVGDWLMAIDERLDFKQRIRIISIDDEFSAEGTRISYTVTAGNVGIVQKYQDSNASLATQVNNAMDAANQAVTDANVALIAANGKNTSYYVDSFDILPKTANEGDLGWVQTGDGRVLYIYTKKPDGSLYWEKRIDPEMGEQIAAGVEEAVLTAKSNSDKAIDANNVLINQTINTVSKQQSNNEIDKRNFDANAQSMVDKAAAAQNINVQNVARQTLTTANANLDQVKKDLTTGIAKEATDRATAVTALDKTAKGYADSAKSDAINAASTADGVINKKIDDTATSIGVTITQNKKDANGGISTAQSMAQQGIDGLKTKVSQNDYNLKTGQLQADLNTTTQTATQSKQDIVAIKQADSSQDARMNSIVADATGTKQTVSNIQTVQGQQSGSITTLQTRADGFDATVERVANLSVGGRNLLTNSKIFGFGIGNNSTTSSTKIDFDTTTKMIHITAPAGGSNNAGIYFSQSTHYDTNLITKGQPWSFSMDIKGTGVYSQFGIEGSSPFNKLQGSVPTEWTRVSSTGVASNGKAIIIYFNATTVALDVYIKLIKLEQGSFPTDYTPAPEDVDSATAKAQLTADTATLNLSNYQTSADGRITKAQADIIATATQVQTKVSQSDYNTKTGDLTTKVSTAQQTADSATTTIGNYKKSNDGRVSTAETNIKSNKDAIALTATKQELNSATSTLNSSIGAVNVKADSVTQIVTSLTNQVNTLGQTNQVHNSQLTPDFSGWHTGSPWGKPITTEFNNSGISSDDSYGAMWVNHDQGVSADWIYSDPIAVINTLPVSVAIYAAVVTAITSGVPLALYVSGYDSNKNKLTSKGYNIPVNQLTGKYTQFKLENILLDKTVSYVSFTLAWNYPGRVYMGKPMMVFAPTVGSYVPGSYNNNDKIALQQITIDGITQTVSTQGTNIDSVTKRVQTAEGNLSTATNRITGVESKQTQLSGQFNQEVTDRKNGDSTTLSQAATYTQSQVSSATSGLNSTITQTANAIIANLGASNLFPNSEFTADSGYRSKSGTVTTAQNQNVDNKINGTVTVISTSAGYQGYWGSNIPVIGGQKYSGATRVHYTNGGLSNGLASLDVWYVDSSGARINGGTGGSWKVQTPQIDSPYWIDLYFDGITAPINASYMQASLIVNNAGAGQKATFTQTTITATDVHQPYTPNDGISATLALFKDKWGIGIKDNIQGIVSGIVGTPTQMSLISKNIILYGNTTVTGDFYALGGNFKNLNASNMTVGTLNGNQVNVTNINANNIVAGTISGASLSINLNTGQVSFQRGRIYSSDYTTDINIDSGYISTSSSNTRAILQRGRLQLIDPSYVDLQTNPYLDISNLGGGLGSTYTFGALVTGRDNITLSNSANKTPLLSGMIGIEQLGGIFAGKGNDGTWYPTRVGGANRGVIISGGNTTTGDIVGSSPYIFVGVQGDLGSPYGNRILINGQYVHIPATYKRTSSSSANVVVSSDGALVRSSSARKYKLDIKNDVDLEDSLKLIDVPLSTWVDKHEHEESGSNERYFGMIAEDLRDAGLEYLIQYGNDNEVEGINYDRVALLLVPLVKKMYKKMKMEKIS
ncbi:hypothetical protein KII95_08770 [Leuconostoc gelidum subsp. aenigmaticum]|uniref:phage tail protein n=1 Tax=Leuconostoc gelidum TaxID=1244 RepID=UPI001CC70618|nr:phage tail protein [Leuconostoc gelidum]MBZ6004100.1 hypothetical protein [Leuconostoc gelidum subsp. aenigmaticum]